MCPSTLIHTPLKCFDPGAFNGGSSVEIEPRGAVLTTFKVVELLQNLKKSHELFPIIFQSAGFRQDPPFDAPGAMLSSPL